MYCNGDELSITKVPLRLLHNIFIRGGPLNHTQVYPTISMRTRQYDFIPHSLYREIPQQGKVELKIPGVDGSSFDGIITKGGVTYQLAYALIEQVENQDIHGFRVIIDSEEYDTVDNAKEFLYEKKEEYRLQNSITIGRNKESYRDLDSILKLVTQNWGDVLLFQVEHMKDRGDNKSHLKDWQFYHSQHFVNYDFRFYSFSCVKFTSTRVRYRNIF